MQKIQGRRGSAPEPADGAYDAPPDSLVGSPFPTLSTPSSAFGTSLSSPTRFKTVDTPTGAQY